MLQGAVESAGIADLLDDVLSVDEVGVFKPHRSVYELVGKRFDTEPDEVLFVFIERMGCGPCSRVRVPDNLGQPCG